jgi:hypothetical protein
MIRVTDHMPMLPKADQPMPHRSLHELLAAFAACPPHQRIDFREPDLGHGAACIAPLLGLVDRRPDLSSSVAAWFEVLVGRDPATRTEVVSALRRIARAPDGVIARGALARLGASESAGPAGGASGPKARSAPEAAVHARVRQAAREGRLIIYSDLETSRGHVGTYLHNLSLEEAAAGHPPITSIVVSKTTMRPGDGYLPAMIEVNYARPGESLDDVWGRAVAEVHAFWAAEPAEPGPEAAKQGASAR